MKLTSSDALLIATASLGDGPQTRSDIVVAAWKQYPQWFGLPGYLALHPHSARVDTKLVATGVLLRCGYIEQVGTGLYHVTDKGRSAAARGGIR